MPETIEANEIEFKFVQPTEFSNPFYLVHLNGKYFGGIWFIKQKWQGTMLDDERYGSGILRAIAEKIDQLNDALAEQRKVFFGL